MRQLKGVRNFDIIKIYVKQSKLLENFIVNAVKNAITDKSMSVTIFFHNIASTIFPNILQSNKSSAPFFVKS